MGPPGAPVHARTPIDRRAEGTMPFLQNQNVDMLQPDLINSGGISILEASCLGGQAKRLGSPVVAG